MKSVYPIVVLGLMSLGATLFAFENENTAKLTKETMMQQDSMLRHVVLFKFKPGTSQENIDKVREAFSALPSKIPEIASYEWGTNNSPEGLDKGFTHAFFLSFKSEEDREVYLPHPDHKAFGEVLSPHLEDVLVLDYWARNE